MAVFEKSVNYRSDSHGSEKIKVRGWWEDPCFQRKQIMYSFKKRMKNLVGQGV